MYNIFPAQGGVCASNGFFADGISAGLKANDAKDMAFIYSDSECDVASVFTTNKMAAAPIKHFRNMGSFKTNFILINSKNANAMTGKAGLSDIDDILSTCRDTKNPIMSSTGVIGARLPKQKIIEAIKLFDYSKKDAASAAKAIMTTDTFSKECAFKVKLEDGSSFNIGAMAKGAGMINPAMATMLCFVITDADIPKDDMNELLKASTESSFNRISVDGDTSTNDTVMLLANKQSKNYDKEAFKEALDKIMFELAMMILKDGEGANKLVAFEVKGAKNEAEAKKASRALSNSLLVKTALFGEDPNWGRIASTIGASGISCDDSKLIIHYDDLLIYSNEFRELDKEREDQAYKIMKQESFKVICDIGIGDGEYTSYGCDLSYEYVKINAEYRT